MAGTTIRFCALTLVLLPAGAGALDLRGGDRTVSMRVGFAVHQDPSARIIHAHGGPVFLGCVYSYHECEHRAHGRGFYNHFTEHDHDTCHHGPSYACYGQ